MSEIISIAKTVIRASGLNPHDKLRPIQYVGLPVVYVLLRILREAGPQEARFLTTPRLTTTLPPFISLLSCAAAVKVTMIMTMVIFNQ